MANDRFNKDDIDLSLHILCPCCENVFTHPVILPYGKSVDKELLAADEVIYNKAKKLVVVLNEYLNN